MLVTITEYSTLGRDDDGVRLPLGGTKIASNGYTADGQATALSVRTRFIRVATDTGIHINMTGGGENSATVNDEFLPAGTVEFFAVQPSTELEILTAI